MIDFAWDGSTDSKGATAADGAYKLVEASQAGNAVTVDALQVGTVSAIVRSSGGFLLDLGSLGRVSFDSVQQINLISGKYMSFQQALSTVSIIPLRVLM